MAVALRCAIPKTARAASELPEVRQRRHIRVRVLQCWVGSLAPSKVHKQKDCCKGVRELKFHPRGEVVAALNDRNQVSFYAANTGTWNFAVQNNAYGISNFEFTHHEYSLLHSTKNRKTNVVFYLSAYDNRYLRQFQGTAGAVTSISMSPSEDQFLSASDKGEVFKWDFRAQKCCAKVQLPDSCHATATYNCAGDIYYVIGGNGTMYSFESRMHGKPITDNFEPIEDIKAGKVRSIKCFPSEEVLVTMESGKVHIVDVFESDIKYSIQCFADGNAGAEKADWMSDWEHPTVPSITGDGRYIVGNARSDGRSIVVHEGPMVPVEPNLRRSVLWKSMMHPTPITAIAASPTSELVVTGCDSSTVFWQPDETAKNCVVLFDEFAVA